MYSYIRSRLEFKGRYGRTRDIFLNMPEDVVAKIQEVVLYSFGLRARPAKQD